MKNKIVFFFKNILSKFGVDKAILFTSLSRVVQALGGFVTVFLIATFMSKEEQGFYYTFASVLAIQIFFELGLGGIINQFVAHEMAHLNFKTSTEIEGKPENISRLSSLLHFCLKWYVILALLLFVTLLIVGFTFFNKYGSSYPLVKWQIPWVVISIGGSLNLLMSPWMAVLQGMNKVKEMARIALIQQLIVMAVTWISLALGAKLYIAAINSMTSFIVMLFLYGRTDYPTLLYNTFKNNIKEKISYIDEIFPLQWKIALSWMSGYFIFQLFNPILFAYSGPVIAGKMGMTLTILSAILGFTLSWTTTKIPSWSMLIAIKDYSTLDISYKKVLKDSTLVSSLAIIAGLIFLTIISFLELKLSDRFLPVWLCAILFLTIPLNNIVNVWATYLRCHKKEPFLVQAIIIGILCGISTFLTGKFIGVTGVVIGYSTIILFVNISLSYYIFRTKKLEYHG